jgi:ribosomal protein S10
LQLPEPPLPIDPRPITQLLSEGDKAVLAEARGPKKIVDAYLRISDAHLQFAFDSIKVNDHNTSERELDIYNKAVAEAAKDTFALTEGKRNVSKKVEQTLFRQIKTLESIDRLFPSEREGFPDAALKHARQLRVQALNAFASGEILKDPDAEKKREDEPRAKSPQRESTPMSPLALQRRVGLDRPRVDQAAQFNNASFKTESASLQMPGDYLTEEEDNHVREAQAADQRVKVFVRIADRRIRAVTGPAALPAEKRDQKKIEEEEHEWGPVPKVSRSELLRHYARAISECMSKLEDAYERNPKSSLLPKALTLLRDSTDRHLQTLRTLEHELKTESELAALRDAIDQAETANKGARDGLKATIDRK